MSVGTHAANREVTADPKPNITDARHSATTTCCSWVLQYIVSQETINKCLLPQRQVHSLDLVDNTLHQFKLNPIEPLILDLIIIDLLESL